MISFAAVKPGIEKPPAKEATARAENGARIQQRERTWRRFDAGEKHKV